MVAKVNGLPGFILTLPKCTLPCCSSKGLMKSRSPIETPPAGTLPQLLPAKLECLLLLMCYPKHLLGTEDPIITPDGVDFPFFVVVTCLTLVEFALHEQQKCFECRKSD